MDKPAVLIAVTFVLCIVGEAFPDPPGSGWRLAWGDEFEGTEIDETKWNVRNREKYGNQLDPSYVHIENGILRLDMTGGRGGWIDSENKFWFKHGYIEARCRLSSAVQQENVWPCFWMKRSWSEWKPEYDIGEYYWHQKTVLQAAHFEKCDGSKSSSASRDEWHVFGCLVRENGKVVYYIDDEVSWQTSCDDPNVPVMVICHALTAGGSAPYPDFLVDYVRYYEEGPARAEAPSITVEPRDMKVVAGGDAAFSVTANGWPLVYQWMLNGQDVPGADKPTYTLSSVTMDNDGAVFSVKVSNDLGAVTSRAATLTVLEWDGVMPAEDFPLGGSACELEAATGAVKVPLADQGSTCEVARPFPGKDGQYRVTLKVIAEDDGQSRFGVSLDGSQVGETYQAPLSSGERSVVLADRVAIREGDTIRVWSQSVDEAYGRWTGLEFTLLEPTVAAGGGRRSPAGPTADVFDRNAPAGARVVDIRGRTIDGRVFGAARCRGRSTTAPGLYVVEQVPDGPRLSVRVIAAMR